MWIGPENIFTASALCHETTSGLRAVYVCLFLYGGCEVAPNAQYIFKTVEHENQTC